MPQVKNIPVKFNNNNKKFQLKQQWGGEPHRSQAAPGLALMSVNDQQEIALLSI